MGSYLVALYAAPNHHWYGALLPDLRWSLIAALATFISIWMNRGRLTVKKPWFSSGAGKILLAYAFWMWIQLPWAVSYEMHLKGCILFTKYIVLFYMIYVLVDNDIKFFQFFLLNIFGGFYWGYLIKVTPHTGRIEHIGGPGIGDSNTMGMHLGIVLIFAALMLLKKNTIFQNIFWWRVLQGFLLIAAVLMANGVVQSISRSAVVGFAAAGMMLFFLNHKAFRMKLLFFAVIAIAGLLYFSPQTFLHRMDTVRSAVEGEEVDASAYSRIIIAQAQIEMFKSNVMGHGHKVL